MFISEALAQTSGSLPAQGSMSSTLIQLGLIFAIFYLLLIRPQQKKIKQHETMLNAIQKGDKVITGGGIYAKVIDASDQFDLIVEIAEGVNVRVNRATVRELLNDEIKLPKTDIIKKDAKKSVANSNKKAKK